MVIACYVSYAALGWYLNGLGSLLPDLENDVGDAASLYPLMPGAVLLVFAIVFVVRHKGAEPANPHTSVIVAGSIGLATALLVMGVTRWTWVSLAGGVASAVAAASLIRLLPATIAIERPHDTEPVMMRANAWSSLAAISAPLAIGGTIALGAGWLPGMAVPIGLAAVVVVATARPRHGAEPATGPQVDDGDAVPPIRAWWREWAVLSTCIVVEFCFSYFAATYLHDELGMSTAAAAAGAAAWGAGMTGGRFVVSVRPAPRTVVPSVVLVALGFALLWFPGEPALAITGIGIAGIGAAPLYPTRLTALLVRFPMSPDQGAARAAIASGTALLVSPALMAGLRAATDVRTAYLAVPVLLVVLLALAKPIATPTRESALAS